MPKFKVLFTDHPWRDIAIETQILERIGGEIVDAPAEDEATLSRLAAECQAIATCWAPVTAKVIQSPPDLQVVCRMGIGLDNIDVAAATARGVPVTNVPDYCVDEVADHTLGLLLALNRKIGFFHLRTKQGEYNLPAGNPIRQLQGLTLGLLGLGRIGTAVLQRARAFGLNIIAHTQSGSDHGTGCRMVDLPTLLQESDFLSLHAPLSDSTRHILNASSLAQCRPGVVILNTSRGGLIDPAALWTSIQSGHIAGAGLDVFEPEPPDLSQPLYQDERVIATPHAAFVSESAVVTLRRRVFEQIVDVFSGRAPPNIVNPEVS